MEGELRGFCKGAKQDQNQRGQIPVGGADRIACLQNIRQVIAACKLAQNDQSPDHGQTTRTRDSQSHTRALATFGQVFPIANQQEGGERGQLPENQQKQDIVRQNDAEHRALEQQKIGVKLPHRVFVRQVEPRIKRDQQAHAQDHARKHQAQTIKEECHLQTHGRQPRDGIGQNLATKYHRGKRAQHNKRQSRGDRGKCGASIAPRADHQPRHQGAQKR